VLSACMLSACQSVCLSAVDLLCQLCQQIDDSLHTECVVAQLLKSFDDDDETSWDCSKPFRVHLVCNDYNLRQRPHDCKLNVSTDDRNFLTRMLLKDIY